MSQLPASHDDSLEKLVEEGYQIAILDDKFLCISIVYLNEASELCEGLLVDPANFTRPNVLGLPQSHQFFFVGSQPFAENGTAVANLGDTLNVQQYQLGSVTASFHLSNKIIDSETGQMRNYNSLYEKVVTYVGQISGPALLKFPEAERALKPALSFASESVFNFPDAHSAHAQIDDLNELLASDRIAIIGLGGTGSYILDFMSKTPVAELHLFDDDEFSIKNLYRFPGSCTDDEFDRAKVEVLAERYGRIRNGIVPHVAKFPTPTVAIDSFTFAFVCVDNPRSRSETHEALLAHGVSFIDVGLGLDREGDELKGMVRSTLVEPDGAEFIRDNDLIPRDQVAEDEYNTNIQIGELNALNASLAVIRFKKLRGFYQDQRGEINSLYVVARNSMISLERTVG